MNETERQIVAWLREVAEQNAQGGLTGNRSAFEQLIIANAIERGDHMETDSDT